MSAARPREPILHVDLDAFYASVEVLKDPSLAGRPVVVGGPGPRGVVLSASYEARKFRIHSAMPSARARRLCPGIVFVPPDFGSYRAYATRFREVLLSFTPLVEPLSLDEAFLDVSGATMLFGDPRRIAGRVRERVQDELSLTCSVGVAPNKFLAKVASVAAKPDGIVVVPADGITAFLHPLRVDALWGVGERTLEVLQRLGVRTVGELAAVPMTVLERTLGQGQARHLSALADGHDERSVMPYEAPKSVSHEETFDRDLDADEDVNRELLRLSLRVAVRLRREGFRARTVVLKVRLASFTTLTRSRTVPVPTDVGTDLYRIASDLYRALPGGRRRIRLLGVGATGLVSAGAEQLALVRAGRWEDAERALDRIERRFGSGTAAPAALLGTEPRRRDAPGTRPGL
ncbi:MAG TPA: DNA polymerase IV [Actinomycetota bacterium]|nr:DNA polymerase IV [Actinomycetota bacterium]